MEFLITDFQLTLQDLQRICKELPNLRSLRTGVPNLSVYFVAEPIAVRRQRVLAELDAADLLPDLASIIDEYLHAGSAQESV